VKILITGAEGQVGKELVNLPTHHTIVPVGKKQLDITNRNIVKKTISAIHPDALVNAAAYTAVDLAESEPERAYAVNSIGPDHLAEVCTEFNILLLHLSTDYVFDGTSSLPYREDDPINPLGIYGKSKAEGEERVKSICRSYIILRTSWVFSPYRKNFVKTIFRLALEQDELWVVSDQYGCPTSAREIAKAIFTILENFKPEHYGTYHFAQPEPTTWYEFAKAIVNTASKYVEIRSRKIVPIQTKDYPTPARRPAWSVLNCQKIDRIFHICPPPWQESLNEVVKIGVVSQHLT